MLKKDIKKLDKAWGELIRKAGKCEICGKVGSLNAHHIVGRRNYTLRWDRRNGCLLCASHHTFAKESAHQDGEWFHDWLVENRKEDLEYLKEQRNKVLKQTYDEVIKLLEE